METFRPVITSFALEQILKDKCLADPRVGTFRLGDLWGSDQSSTDTYTLILFHILRAKHTRKNHQSVMNYRVRLFAVDARMSSWENVSQSLSHEQNVLVDLSVRLLGDRALQEAGWRFTEETFDLEHIPLFGDANYSSAVSMEFSVSTPVILCASDTPAQ